MKKKLFDLWKTYKSKQKINKELEVIHTFNITERGGVIFITANTNSGNKAIKVIGKNETSEYIIRQLNECREAQLKYIEPCHH